MQLDFLPTLVWWSRLGDRESPFNQALLLCMETRPGSD